MALDTAILTVGIDAKPAVAGAARAKVAIRSVGRQAKETSSNLSKLKSRLFSIKGVAIAAAAGIIVKGFVSAAKAAAKFETAMLEVSTLLDDTPGQLDELSDASKRLAVQFGTAPTEQAAAFYQIISAGATSAAQATDILTVANKLALGGVTTVEIAADGLTSVLNAYGDEVESATAVSDAMFVAMKAGKTTIGELSNSLGLVAPLAVKVGVSFDELVSTVAALTKGGIKTKVAVSGIRAVLAAVVKPSKEASDLAKELGIEFNVASLRAKTLAGFLEHLADKTKGSTELMGQLFGGVEALIPVLQLAGKAGLDLTDILEDIGKKAGETDKAANKMASSGEQAFKRLNAAVDDLLIKLGDVFLPTLAKIAEALVDMLTDDTAAEKIRQQMDVLTTTIRQLNREQESNIKSMKLSGGQNALLRAQITFTQKTIDRLTASYNVLADVIKKKNIEEAATKPKPKEKVAPPEPLAPGIDTDAVDALKKEIEAIARVADGLDELRSSRADEMAVMLLTGAERDKMVSRLRVEADIRAAMKTGIDQSEIKGEIDALLAQQQQREILIDKLYAQKQATKDLNEEKKKQNKLDDETANLVESLRTPMQIYIDDLKKLDELLAKTSLSQDQFNKAVDQAKDKLIESDPALKKISGGIDEFADALVEGELSMKSFGNVVLDVLQDIVKEIISSNIKGLLKDLIPGAGGGSKGGSIFSSIGSLFSGGGGGGGFGPMSYMIARGGVFQNGNPTAFNNGGVVNSPTFFPMANGGTGLMGEAGPEAVVPLKRGRDGKLGIAGGGGGGTVINIDARGSNGDAAVEAAVERGIRHASPQLINASVNRVKEGRQRDPAFFGSGNLA